MVEHGTENAGVDSSSLSLGTTTKFRSWEGVRKAVLATLGRDCIMSGTFVPHSQGNR